MGRFVATAIGWYASGALCAVISRWGARDSPIRTPPARSSVCDDWTWCGCIRRSTSIISAARFGDSVWADTVNFRLANSVAKGDAKVWWGSGLPVRYDIRLHGDTVAMADVAWIHASLPQTGGGSTDLTIRNDPKNLSIIEYGLHNVDARSMRSRLVGRMTFGTGGEVLRITDVGLDLQPAHTDLLRHFDGEPFPYDWQGDVRGRVNARGGLLR